MRQFILISIIISIISITPALSTIYKCTDENGVATFSDQPCSTDAEIVFNNGGSGGGGGSIDNVLGFTDRVHPKQAGSLKLIGMDLKLHTANIGKHIFSGEKYQMTQSMIVHGATPSWDTFAIFGPDNHKNKYKVSVQYGCTKKNDNYSVYILKLEIKKDGNSFDPDVTEGITSLKKIGIGRWVRK